MTPTGLTKDAGWQVGVSKTVDGSPEEVWEVLTSPDGLAAWLGEGSGLGPSTDPGSTYETDERVVGEIRTWRPGDRVRLTWQPPDWDHETTVQVAVGATSSGRTTLRFHQERLASAEERQRQRTHWQSCLSRVVELLG